MFLVQRTFYNQPAETCLKIRKNVCVEVIKIQPKNDLVIVAGLVLYIFV